MSDYNNQPRGPIERIRPKRRINRKVLFISILILRILLDLLEFYMRLNREFDDFVPYSQSGRTILEGGNPYSLKIAEKQYPPGHFYFYALVILLFGESPSIFKFVVICFYWADSFMVFKITGKMIEIYRDFSLKHPNFKNNPIRYLNKRLSDPYPIVPADSRNGAGKRYLLMEDLPWIAMFIFMFMPAVRMRTFDGLNDSITTFFFALFLYFFLEGRKILYNVFFAISMMLKLTTLFITPLMLMYLFKNKKNRELLYFISINTIVAFSFFAPFLLDDFTATLQGVGTLFHEKSTVSNLFSFIPDYEVIHTPIFSVGPLEFSGWFIFQLSAFIIINLYLYTRIKNENLEMLFLGMLLIYLFIPPLTHSFGTRYYVWAAPIICPYITLKRDWRLIIVFLLFYVYSIIYYNLELYVLSFVFGLSINLVLIIYVVKKISHLSPPR